MDAQIVSLLTDKIDKVDAKVDAGFLRIETKLDTVIGERDRVKGGVVVIYIIGGIIIQILIGLAAR